MIFNSKCQNRCDRCGEIFRSDFPVTAVQPFPPFNRFPRTAVTATRAALLQLLQRRMRLLLPCAVILLVLLASSARAVCWPALGSALGNGYAACTTTVVAGPHGAAGLTAGPSGNDLLSSSLSLPFNFAFAGLVATGFTRIVISTNGVIFLGSNSGVPATSQPSPTAPLSSALQGYTAIGEFFCAGHFFHFFSFFFFLVSFPVTESLWYHTELSRGFFFSFSFWILFCFSASHCALLQFRCGET
jgi:hypothetical protein